MSLTAAQALEAMEHLPLRGFETLGVRGLVVVAPHPDDESLGCGGLIAAARAAGVGTHVVIVSDGSGSHPNSRTHPPERLRSLRKQEALQAVAELGIAPEGLHLLSLPDRFVPTEGFEADAAVGRLRAIADACNASHITVTWRHDPHTDHRASAVLAERACAGLPGVALLAYPIWAATLPPDTVLDEGELRGFRLEVGTHLPAKRRAIAAHRSQITALIDDDPKVFRLSAADLARFDRPFEIYLETAR